MNDHSTSDTPKQSTSSSPGSTPPEPKSRKRSLTPNVDSPPSADASTHTRKRQRYSKRLTVNKATTSQFRLIHELTQIANDQPMTYQELCERSGVPEWTWQSWRLRGVAPTLFLLEAMGGALGYTLEWRKIDDQAGD